MAIKPVLVSTTLMYGLWLLLSGHATPLLLTLGFLSALGVSLIAYRMGLLDEEGLPIGILLQLPKIALWLIWEILKSNFSVMRIILSPSKVQAGLVTLKASQRTIAGLVTHANFITLTPGTLSVHVDEIKKEILVHGLTQNFCDSVLQPDMDTKVSRLEVSKLQNPRKERA